MNGATFLVLGFALASGTVLKTVLPPLQETQEAKRAVAIVKEAGGNIVFDEKAPGKPVVSVNL